MTNPSRARWSQIKDVFFQALDLSGAEQARFIEQTSAGDPDLAAEVRRLLELSGHAGSFLEEPAAVALALNPSLPRPAFPSGYRLADRYRTTRLIGQGGMGDVYEAHDETIDDIVALKVARPGSESLETLAARWRREVTMARRISHPGVCRVHDVAVHQQDGRQWLVLTMERLSGPSLQARLRAKDLSLAESLDLARRIGAALDESHARDVVHRDIKPDNIVLDVPVNGRARPVLTDFGLARDANPDMGATVTTAGVIAGTLGYLAPEILRGDPPSPRSDLFAFATVVREMLASAPPVSQARAQRVLDRALSAKPGARYPTATAFVAALERAVTPRRLSPRASLAATAAIIVVALTWAGIRYYLQTPQLTSASEVLLTAMMNGTTNREFDGAGEVFRSQIAQSPHFGILAPARVASALANMGRTPGDLNSPEVAREVAMREGVPLVVFATLSQLAQDYSVSVKIERVGSRPSLTRHSWTQTFTTPSKTGVFDALHDAAVWIRRMSGEAPASVEAQDRPASETTTSSWQALELYMRANALTTAGRDNDATLLLEAAIRADPDFAMAQMQLGDRLIALKRDKEGYLAWQRAIDLLERKQLTSRETLRIRGQYFDDTGDLIEAEKAYRTYAVHYPNDFEAVFFLGNVLVELDRTAEALQWLETAHQLRPRSLAGASHLTLAYLDLGRSADVTRLIGELDHGGFSDWAQWFRALSALAGVGPSAALELLEPLRTSADLDWQSRAFTIRASWLSELGRDAEAIAELRAGIRFDEEHGFRDRLADKWLHLAELQRRARDPAAVASAHRAIETASNLRRVVAAATLLMRVGDRKAAGRLLGSLDEFPQVPRTIAAKARIAGQRHLEDGAAAQAVEAFERAFAVARRRENRLAFARALARAGEPARAEALLSNVVARPAVIYSGPEPQAPGLWREAIAELIALVSRRDRVAADELRRRYESMTLLSGDSK